MLSIQASAMPDMAWVRPAPGTTFTQPSVPVARQTASAAKDADCSSVTRMGRTDVDPARAS
jgi:hypothetical protein